MDFKQIFLEHTNLPEDIINKIIKLKYEMDISIELENFFKNCQNIGVTNISNPLWCLNKLTSLHDLIYFMKYYYNDQDFLHKIRFNISLLFVDSCDYYYFQENDEFFKNKKFTYEEVLNMLPLKFNYIYLNRICLTKDGYINSCGYVANIRLEDPEYQKVYIKKHKKIKFFKKIIYNFKQKFLNML